MHYEIIQWEKVVYDLLYIVVYYSVQTLTVLDLSDNEITDKGAEHIADLLRNNTVRETIYSFISY